MEKDFDNNNENCIEFLSGEHYAVATFTNRKHINRIKNIYTDRKDEFKYLKENKDGSICVKFPLKWVKINPGAIPDPNKPKRVMSEEQKEKMRQSLRCTLAIGKMDARKTALIFYIGVNSRIVSIYYRSISVLGLSCICEYFIYVIMQI